MRPKLRLGKNSCPKTDQGMYQMNLIPYALAIGSITLTILCTRPAIAYELSVISRF